MHALPPWGIRRVSRLALDVTGIVVPITILAVGVRADLPAFVFEHLIVLVVVALAVAGGRRPAIIAAVAGSIGDNLLLRDPIGRPAISGTRDLIDLVLFLAVAVTVGWLVDSLRAERARAHSAAERERRAREDRDRLVATLAHDLAMPLSAISGTVQFMRRHTALTEDDIERLLTRVETASRRATSLVRALTDAKSLEEHTLALDRQPLDLRAVVEPIVRVTDHVSDRHSIALKMDAAPIEIMGDEERLGRAVENLIANAIKYSPDGGVIDVHVTRAGGFVVVKVRDRGIGIAPEDRDRLFEMGYRSPRAAGVAPGLGLGLYTAFEVVRLHGGTITSDAADGGGTVFTLRLPFAAGDRPSDRPRTSGAAEPPGMVTGSIYASERRTGSAGHVESRRGAAAGPRASAPLAAGHQGTNQDPRIAS